MNTSEIMYWLGEYDDIVQLWDGTYKCYIEYLDETHTVTIKGRELWAYNEATNHTWVLN